MDHPAPGFRFASSGLLGFTPLAMTATTTLNSNQSGPSALTFCGGADCGDDFEHLAEDTNRWVAANNINTLDRYRQGDVCIVLDVLFRIGSEQHQFIFHRVPPGTGGSDVAQYEAVKTGRALPANSAPTLAPSSRQFVLFGGYYLENRPPGRKGNQGEVLLGVAQLVHGPEDVIPSFVSVAAPKKRDDFRRQILAASGDLGGPMRLVFSEGKCNMLAGFAFRGDGTSVPALIEGCPKIVNGIEQDTGQVGRERPTESDLMKLVETVRSSYRRRKTMASHS